jgi:DNA-binding XRE family transcriptional regulator
MSQAELGLAAGGVGRWQISRIESGKRQPSPRVARAIAETFQVDVDRIWVPADEAVAS